MDLVYLPHYFPYPALDVAGYGSKIRHLLELYPWEIQLTQLNLLSSHDVARALSVVGEDEASMVLATLLLFTFPGAPSIYYGDEVGLPGELDPDSRRTFPHEKDWNQTLLKHHKELIALRHQHPSLRIGRYEVLHATDHTYVFARHLDSERTVVAVNTAEMTPVALATQDLLVSKESTLRPVFTYGEVRCETDKLALPPRSGLIAKA
jgi:glycosidase